MAQLRLSIQGNGSQFILLKATILERFEDKSVIVTGAGQGIGKECALLFAREGARVMIADREKPTAEQACSEIRKSGGQAEFFIGDLEKSRDAHELMQVTNEKFGRIDISVHNVGGTIWTKPFLEYTDEQIEKEIQRSLWPTLWCCKAVLPIMEQQKSGSIVNVGSIATRGINRVPYSAAKGGVHALTTCLALETALSGIRVNCVAPGGTDVEDRSVPRFSGELTDIDRAGRKGVMEQTLRDTPLGRFGTVGEQAAAIAFLASDQASYITGQTLCVGGGAIG